MSVVRIDEFRAIENRHDDLRSALAEILIVIRGAAGCQSVQIFQSETEPERVVIVEEWQDRAAHQAALASVAPTSLHRVMALLAEVPLGGYFSALS